MIWNFWIHRSKVCAIDRVSEWVEKVMKRFSNVNEMTNRYNKKRGVQRKGNLY